MQRVRLRIYGYVQGVGFRYFVRQQAMAMGVSGFTRNLPDGSVEVILQGEEEAVKMVADACRLGPPSAIVEKVEEEVLPPSDSIEGFKII